MKKPAILYDSYCRLCNSEIEYYRKKDHRKIFDYIDIINPRFKPEHFDLTKAEVHKYFHVISKEGKILKGLEAFNYIWKALDTFNLLQKVYSLRVGKFVMNIGYNGFVKIRPYLPRKKKCDEYCEI